MSALRRKRITLAAFALVMLLFFGIGVLTYSNAQDLIASDDLVAHTYEVQAGLESAYAALSESESARRAFALSGDPQYLEQYVASQTLYAAQIARLAQMTADNPAQQQKLQTLNDLAAQKDRLLQQTIDLRNAQPDDRLPQADLVARGSQTMQQIRNQISKLQGEEMALLQNRRTESRSNAQNTEITVVAGYVLGLAGLTLVFMRLLHELDVRQRAEDNINWLNDALNDHISELTRLNTELHEFSYGMSHDLRQPLRALDGFSLALLEDYNHALDATGQDYLNRIRSASQRMGWLIDDWVNLTRVTRMEMHRSDLNLSALVEEIVAGMRRVEPMREMRVDIAPDIHGNGDPLMLRLVLENLLSNAWKFTGEEPHAHIEFGTTVANGKSCYYVRDNGVGFDAAYANKLFGTFERLHGAKEFPGTGMGLAIVRRIILRHGGQVWAEGSVGRGAQFYFTLE